MSLKQVVAGIVFKVFIHSAWMLRNGLLSKVWYLFWELSLSCFKGVKIQSRVHGYAVTMPYGYTYPVYARRFANLNDPLIELVCQCFLNIQKPICMIDVGAAIGDTYLLIESNCSKMIQKVYSIDGDPEFYGLLTKNLKSHEKSERYQCLLSDSKCQIPELARVHSGTASAQGKEMASADTLDNLLSGKLPHGVDILKTDLDGYDGKVLAGSQNIINTYQPAIIFEWHPGMIRQTHNRETEAFDVLVGSGYDRFIWFDKYGKYSHQTKGDLESEIHEVAEKCVQGIDYYYDIIALHHASKIDAKKLIALVNAKNRKSHY